MRRNIFISTLVLALLTMMSPAPAEAGAQVTVGLSFFYDELSPYGEWVTVSNYGRVWCPRAVGAGWQPYLHGEWIYTDYGWTWVSFDPWSSDPYHYGTWVFTAEWGWAWLPGNIWAPAWVTWCDAGSSIGWAPVPPSLSLGLVGYRGPAVVASPPSYVFVPTQSFVGVDVRTVRIDPARNATFVSGGQKITSFAVSGGVVRTGGPQVARIQKVAGPSVRTATLADAKTRAIPIASGGGSTRALAVIAPERDRAAAWRQHESEGGKTAMKVERQAERSAKPIAEAPKAPAPKKVTQDHAQKPPQSSREMLQPPRPAERPHDMKVQHPPRLKEPPHETKAQAPPRPKEPPHETKAQAPPQAKERPHDMKVQHPPRPAERPPETKAQAPARKQEKPGS